MYSIHVVILVLLSCLSLGTAFAPTLPQLSQTSVSTAAIISTATRPSSSSSSCIRSSSPTTQLYMSIFDDPGGWFQRRMDIMKDKRQITLYHILINDRYLESGGPDAVTTLESIKTNIMKNAATEKQFESFQNAAKESSMDTTSGSQGGYLGTFKRGQLYQTCDDAVFAPDAPTKQVFGPIKSLYGQHLFWIDNIMEE